MPHYMIFANIFKEEMKKVKWNNNSNDETYTTLISNLREKLKILARKITPKVFEYGFLKK